MQSDICCYSSVNHRLLVGQGGWQGGVVSYVIDIDSCSTIYNQLRKLFSIFIMYISDFIYSLDMLLSL